jgi:hypothetical protein
MSANVWWLSCHAIDGAGLMHLWVGIEHCSTGRRFSEEATQIIARDDLLYRASGDVPDLDESWLDSDNVWIMESCEMVHLHSRFDRQRNIPNAVGRPSQLAFHSPRARKPCLSTKNAHSGDIQN